MPTKVTALPTKISATAQEIQDLDRCGDVQSIIDEGSRILGNPILAHNMEYKLLSYAKTFNCDDDIWMEFIILGTVSEARIDFFQSESFIDAAANTKSVTLMQSDSLKYDRIVGKLFTNDGIQLGCVCMVASNSPLKIEDYKLFEIFCKVLSRKMSQENCYNEYAIDYQKRMISTLIEGTYKDKGKYSPHVANIYDGLGSKIYLMLADVSGSTLKLKDAGEYINWLKEISGEHKYYEYNGHIVVIFSLNDDRIIPEKDLPELCDLFVQNNIYAGISSRFDNLFMLNKYYTQALKALNHALIAKACKNVFCYGKNGIIF